MLGEYTLTIVNLLKPHIYFVDLGLPGGYLTNEGNPPLRQFGALLSEH
jgi:hypothetical protein